MNIEIVKNLKNLEILELGECLGLAATFGTKVIACLPKLKKLRLERCHQGSFNILNILEGVAKSAKLTDLELVDFDIRVGFDTYLANCINLRKLRFVPRYSWDVAASNRIILSGVINLRNLTHFNWGICRYTSISRSAKQALFPIWPGKKIVDIDRIEILTPIPCGHLIQDVLKRQNSTEFLTYCEIVRIAGSKF